MFRLRNFSISKKLTLVNMLVSAAALLLAGASFFAYDLYAFRVGIVRNLNIQARIIGTNTEAALVFNDPKSAETTLSALQASPRIIYGGIYTADMQLFAAYWRQTSRPKVSLPQLSPGQPQAYWFRDGHIEVANAIILQGKPIGTVYLWSDMQALYDRLKKLCGNCHRGTVDVPAGCATGIPNVSARHFGAHDGSR